MKTPLTVVIETNGNYEYRPFGKKLPKNSVPIGVIDSDGHLTYGDGIHLTDEEHQKVLAVGIVLTSETPTEAFEGEGVLRNRNPEEVIREYGAKRFTEITPELASALRTHALGIPLEAFQGLHSERIERIQSLGATSFSKGSHEVLDIVTWVAENAEGLTYSEYAEILGHSGPRSDVEAWINILVVRMAAALGGGKQNAAYEIFRPFRKQP